MKPFLLLQSRPETAAADNEYEAFRQFGGLESHQLQRIAMHQGELGDMNLEDYSGIILGGGPGNVTDPVHKKSSAELEFEPKLYRLLQEIVDKDFPFLGACLGVGLLTNALGGVVSRRYAESVGPVTITKTDEGHTDPLLAELPVSFEAFVGHKEACEVLPQQAVLLAGSATCPVQLFRIGRNVYATQFHPELDAHGLELRVNIYQHAGYFEPHEVDSLVQVARSAVITEPEKFLRRFIEKYATP